MSASEENKETGSQLDIKHNCETLNDGIKFLINDAAFDKSDDQKYIYNIKIITNEDFKVLGLMNLKKLQRKFLDQNVIILISTVNNSKFLIYWKSNDIRQFLTLKPYRKAFSETDEPLCEYVVDFLAKSLKNGHLGINQNFDIWSNKGKIELHSLVDSRDYNLLLLTSEAGNVKPIEVLLKYGINPQVNQQAGLVTVQDLAWKGRHFNVLLTLLQANLQFPTDIDVSICSEEFKRFMETYLEFHKMIEDQNKDKLDEILKKHPNLRYFYNLSNKSALKAALDLKLIDIYELLISKNLSFAPHEDIDEIWEQFTKSEKIKLRNINIKYLKDIPEKHINVLMFNTSLSHDEEDEEGKRKLILRAYKALNVDPRHKIILKVVAATKTFHIIFDFHLDSTCRIDPVTSSWTRGIFYFSGRIIIGAKQLLDQETENETFGVLIHELCHYAVLAVYQNQSDPFKANDQEANEELLRIAELCKVNMEEEPVIQSVFDDYPEEHQASELIVRPPHLIALYSKEPEILEEVIVHFNALFDYFERIIIPAMERALPEIEGRLVYKPTHTYVQLSDQDKKKVRNAIVKYKNVEIMFTELFPGNSDIFEHLTSDHISLMLENKVLNFDDPQLRYLEEELSFKWENLPQKLKKKFLNSTLNFQGEIVKFKALNRSCPEAFHSLTSQQIINILSNKAEFSIGCKFEPESEFYVERNFIPEDAKLINFEYEYGHDYVFDSQTSSERKKIRTKNSNFEEFTENFLKSDFSQILQKVKENVSLKLWSPNINHEDFHFIYKKSAEIIENDKILILSSEAGAGKTSTFEHLAIELKAKYPNKWVSYIDLAKYTKFYKTNQNIENLLKDILELNSEKNNFEVRIFEECLKSGNLILIWNGFDEVSPNYNEFILNVFKFIHKNTSNIQFISTRPLYSDQLGREFNVRTWQLVPFDEEIKNQFLRKTLLFKNIKKDKIEENVEKIEKIIQKLKFKNLNAYFFDTPLILKILADINDKNESSNTYKIFESFVERKIEIWLEKSKNFLILAKKLILSGSIMKIFQKFALLNEFRIFSSTTLGLKMRKLQIMQSELPQDLTSEEISSLGILFINGKNEFEFSHKTLSEFFVAQYFIENVYNVENDVNVNEAELRLELFYHLTKVYGDVQELITDFMTSYLQMRPQIPKKFNPTISKLLRTKFKNFFIRMLVTNYPKVFEFLFEFFKPDHDLLVDLLHVHEPETFYTAIFNPNHFALFTNPEEIENLALNCLTDVEFQKFVIGRNQIGKIMFGGHFYGLLGIKKSSSYDKELKKLNFDDKLNPSNLDAIKPRNTQFWEFFQKIKHKLTIGEQKALFVTALSPKIYLFYKIFSTSDFFEYENFWTNFEKLLTQNEMQDALGNAIVDYFEIEAGEKIGHENFLLIFIEKCEAFLTDFQIFEMFLTKNILHKAHWDAKSFKILWSFLKNYTNEEEQRQVLLQDDFDDKNFDFHYSYDESKNLYFNYEYSYYYYDFTKFKILHKSLIISNNNNFEFTKQIYQKLFHKTEFQDIITSSNDFICYVIGKSDEQACRNFAAYLLELFKGNEKKLKEFLDRKIKPTNLSVFELVEDFRGLSHSESHWFNNLDTFIDLREKIE